MSMKWMHIAWGCALGVGLGLPQSFATPDLNHALGLLSARDSHGRLADRLDAVVAALERGGLGALDLGDDDDVESVFVVDPATGAILAGDESRAEELFHVNGKSIARAAIEQWRAQRGAGWAERAGEGKRALYSLLHSRIAIDDDGRLYVVVGAVGGAELGRALVERLIDRAGKALREDGPTDALAALADPGGEFRTPHTYVYVYEDGRCLLNPNYPELVGKTPGEMAPPMDGIVRGFLALAERDGAGWTEVAVRNPATGKDEPKNLYVRRFRIGGKTYVVGSGIYGGGPADGDDGVAGGD
jgi:hypothetical protein